MEGQRPPVRKYFEDHGYEQIDRYLEMDRGNRYFQRKKAPRTQDGAALSVRAIDGESIREDDLSSLEELSSHVPAWSSPIFVNHAGLGELAHASGARD